MPETFHPFDYQVRPIDWLYERKEGALFMSPGLGKTVITLTALDRLFMDGLTRGALIVAPIRVCAITWPLQIARWKHTAWMRIADMRTKEGELRWVNGDFDVALINSEQLASIEQLLKCKVCDGTGIDEYGIDSCAHCGFVETRFPDGEVTRKVRKEVKPGYIGLRYPKFVERFVRKQDSLPVDTVIFDELSLAKSTSSVRFNALRQHLHDSPPDAARQFKSHFKRWWGLTGTPIPNDYLDLHPQIRLLDNGKRLGRSHETYKKTWFRPAGFGGYKHELIPGSKEKIDKKVADLALVMLSDDYLDIPTTTYEDVAVEIPATAKKAYKELEKKLLTQLETGEIEAVSAAAKVNKLLQVAGGTVYDADRGVHKVHDKKLDALRRLRKKHAKEPLLVMTAYKHEMARVLEEFPEAVKFDEKLIPAWRRGEIPMMVCNPRSMSHGIDSMQEGGRIIVWLTLTYSNETYLQSNARLIRTGQSNRTIVYRIIVPGTIDDAICEALRTKSDEQSGLMNALKALQRLSTLN